MSSPRWSGAWGKPVTVAGHYRGRRGNRAAFSSTAWRTSNQELGGEPEHSVSTALACALPNDDVPRGVNLLHA